MMITLSDHYRLVVPGTPPRVFSGPIAGVRGRSRLATARHQGHADEGKPTSGAQSVKDIIFRSS